MKQKRKVELGRVVMTRAIADRIEKDTVFGKFCEFSLARHENCDWGEVDGEDRQMNEDALKSGEDRFMSVYQYPGHTDDKIWIITEWDHSATTILFPSDY